MADRGFTTAGLVPPPRHIIEAAVSAALAEDLGRRGDITSNSVIAAEATGRWAICARQPGRVAGMALAALAFTSLDHLLTFSAAIPDGEDVAKGEVIASIDGPVRAALAGERTALNFLGHLGGIATMTAHFVSLIAGSGAAVCCTRKTTPGLRALEKYAVRAGGGQNHRFGLDDAVLIKDNHLAAAGGIEAAMTAARAHAGHMVKIEVEVDNLDQLRQALSTPGGAPDVILLDNMSPDVLTEAVRIAGRNVVLEASGGVNETTIAAIAATGVDLISVGALTHSAPVLDIGLDAVQ